ncbi:J domain-containing protein [Nonomuraea glycinis]|uniref:J domain-containing protein n=1 Tax=Nonomuraea glycinis TaxID=2047744 RepID=UPI002E12DAB6|nr:J domain-containing protein [Nonomuraea glycinis]
MTTAEAEAIVAGARSAAELFAGGSPVRVYRRLARLLHPDVSPGSAAAFARLATLWEIHNQGQRVGRYRVGPPLHKGGTAVLYPAATGAAADAGSADGPGGRAGSGPDAGVGGRAARGPDAGVGGAGTAGSVGGVVLKVARVPVDSHLLVREATALRELAGNADPRFLPYIPRLIEKFRYKTGTTVRQANVISRAPDGFVGLDRIGTGLDPRDVAWIWRRMLVAVGLAHRAGIAHGAVLPRHVLVHPLDHGLILVDWCQAQDLAPTGGTLGTPGGTGAGMSPGGTRTGMSPGGTAPAGARGDVQAVTRCVAGLLGEHPKAMRAFVRGCLLRPPADAWALLAELDELLETLYGPRTYRPLHL